MTLEFISGQEFVDARRQPSIQNAPQVLYSNRDPPLEIRHVAGLRNSDDIGYVTFVLFPRHFANAAVSAATISHIQLFRDYLHYHIKCSKAYMHSRMRHRVTEFQKVLNRAKTEVATGERKTVRYVLHSAGGSTTLTSEQWEDVDFALIIFSDVGRNIGLELHPQVVRGVGPIWTLDSGSRPS